MRIKNIIFITILIFSLNHFPLAHAMFEDKETVSALKKINNKISDMDKTADIVRYIEKKKMLDLYNNLSKQDQERVLGDSASKDSELSHIVSILTSIKHEGKSPKDAVRKAELGSLSSDEDTDELDKIAGKYEYSFAESDEDTDEIDDGKKIYNSRKTLLIQGIEEIESKIGKDTKYSIKELIKNRDIFGRYASLTNEDKLAIKNNNDYSNMSKIIINYTENIDCKEDLEKSINAANIY